MEIYNTGDKDGCENLTVKFNTNYEIFTKEELIKLGLKENTIEFEQAYLGTNEEEEVGSKTRYVTKTKQDSFTFFTLDISNSNKIIVSQSIYETKKQVELEYIELKSIEDKNEFIKETENYRTYKFSRASIYNMISEENNVKRPEIEDLLKYIVSSRPIGVVEVKQLIENNG